MLLEGNGTSSDIALDVCVPHIKPFDFDQIIFVPHTSNVCHTFKLREFITRNRVTAEVQLDSLNTKILSTLEQFIAFFRTADEYDKN